MELEFKVKLDTEKEQDIELIEDLMEQLHDLKEILENIKNGLNNTTTTRK